MAEPTSGLDLGAAAALLAAGVIAVPVFKRVGLGSVLGYLAAGLAIGPFGLGLFQEPETILHVAEFGVVIFLFIIGLEMRPKRLWGLRKDIFGLGATQVMACGLLMTLAAMAVGVPAPVAFVGAMGFVLSSTAVIMQMLEERGEIAGASGQRAVSILLLEDLAIVPLLAVVAVLATLTGVVDESAPPLWQTIAFAVAAVAGVLAAGRWAVNPVFRLLARYGGREVMTAAALLVVVGAAWAMSLGGLSMAMGAFLAGVLLSESTFRHQLEADVEPFRAILLGLFFLSVGMSLDLSVVVADWRLVVGGVVAFMAVKALGIYAVARLFKASHHEAVERAALFAQGGEFAFVPLGAARDPGDLLAVTVKNERVGQAQGAQLGRDGPIRRQGETQVRKLGLPVAVHRRPVVVVRHRQDHQVLRMARGQPLQGGHLHAAGAAPSRPHVDDDDAAPEIGVPDRLTGPVGDHERRDRRALEARDRRRRPCLGQSPDRRRPERRHGEQARPDEPGTTNAVHYFASSSGVLALISGQLSLARSILVGMSSFQRRPTSGLKFR